MLKSWRKKFQSLNIWPSFLILYFRLYNWFCIAFYLSLFPLLSLTLSSFQHLLLKLHPSTSMYFFSVWPTGLRVTCLNMGGKLPNAARVSYVWLQHLREWHLSPPSKHQMLILSLGWCGASLNVSVLNFVQVLEQTAMTAVGSWVQSPFCVQICIFCLSLHPWFLHSLQLLSWDVP